MLPDPTHGVSLQNYLLHVAPCGLGSIVISPPRFLAECRMRRLNQANFVLLYLVFVVSVLELSSVSYFPACTDVNGTVQPNCADVPIRNCSLSLSLICYMSTHNNVRSPSYYSSGCNSCTQFLCERLLYWVAHVNVICYYPNNICLVHHKCSSIDTCVYVLVCYSVCILSHAIDVPIRGL